MEVVIEKEKGELVKRKLVVAALLIAILSGTGMPARAASSWECWYVFLLMSESCGSIRSTIDSLNCLDDAELEIVHCLGAMISPIK